MRARTLEKTEDSRAFMDEKTTKTFNQLSWYHQHMSSSHESQQLFPSNEEFAEPYQDQGAEYITFQVFGRKENLLVLNKYVTQPKNVHLNT